MLRVIRSEAREDHQVLRMSEELKKPVLPGACLIQDCFSFLRRLCRFFLSESSETAGVLFRKMRYPPITTRRKRIPAMAGAYLI
jgi:hypothetical protein